MIRMLQLVPEPLPTHRADLRALFGKYLPRFEILCDIVGKGGGVNKKKDDYDHRITVQCSRATGGRIIQEMSFVSLCVRRLFDSSCATYDLIQIRDMVTIGAIALLAARLRRQRFAYWMSFLMSEARLERAAQTKGKGGVRWILVWLKGKIEHYLLYRLVLPRADFVFVQSDAMLNYVATRGINREKLMAVPMGVDTENTTLFSASRHNQQGRRNGTDAPTIGYLGTLDRMRKLEIIIQALALVRRELPNCRLVLIGDSEVQDHVDAIRGEAQRQGVDAAMHITGWLPVWDAMEMISKVDVAVSPYPRGEIIDTNSPTKLVEYLALGLPSVGNDNPDQQTVLCESGCGVLCDGTARGYASALLAILRDLPAARLRAATGPEYVETHRSYRILAEKVAKAYLSICGQAV